MSSDNIYQRISVILWLLIGPVEMIMPETHTMFERITFSPDIMGGRACIRGMRIPVSVIVGQIAHGASFDEILDGYPDLVREDIQQAIEYAAWLAQEEVHTV
jgi:uncharacterized protein (DUF433 family)